MANFLESLGRTSALPDTMKDLEQTGLGLRALKLQEAQAAQTAQMNELNIAKGQFELNQQRKTAEAEETPIRVQDLFKDTPPEAANLLTQFGQESGLVFDRGGVMFTTPRQLKTAMGLLGQRVDLVGQVVDLSIAGTSQQLDQLDQQLLQAKKPEEQQALTQQRQKLSTRLTGLVQQRNLLDPEIRKAMAVAEAKPKAPANTFMEELITEANRQNLTGTARVKFFTENQAEAAGSRALSTERMKAFVEREMTFPKVRNAMTALGNQWTLVNQYLETAKQQVSPYTAGVGSLVANIPATTARDLRETLNSIKANIGFDKLQQMRRDSPTGGALGQVSDLENKLLQAVQGSLDQGQSVEQLQGNLNTIQNMLHQIQQQTTEAFYTDYAEFAGKPPSQQQGGDGQPKPLDAATAAQLLQEAGGDKTKARQLAKERGYTF